MHRVMPGAHVHRIVVLLISSVPEAFVTNCRPSLMRTKNLLLGATRVVSPLQGSSTGTVLRMSGQEVVYDENGDINQDHVLDEYQKNPKGLAEGDIVTVVAKDLRFYHIRKYKEEGFDPAGMVGTILKLKLKSDKWPEDDGLWTANRPVFVQFLIPMKFRAHFEFPELRKATEEELEKFQAEKDEQDAAAAAAQERLEAERAAEAKAAE
ncbi:unnamed protein product [Ascophyllum nodosum]